MQSTRFIASNMLRQSQLQASRGSGMAARRAFQTTSKRTFPAPKEEHAAHTISQRLRQMKKIPPELIPIGVVLFAALAGAAYSMGRKLFTDKTLRLHRQGNGGH